MQFVTLSVCKKFDAGVCMLAPALPGPVRLNLALHEFWHHHSTNALQQQRRPTASYAAYVLLWHAVQMANQVAQAQSKAQAALQALQDQMQQHLAGEQSLVPYVP
jgi:predicted ATPase